MILLTLISSYANAGLVITREFPIAPTDKKQHIKKSPSAQLISNKGFPLFLKSQVPGRDIISCEIWDYNLCFPLKNKSIGLQKAWTMKQYADSLGYKKIWGYHRISLQDDTAQFYLIEVSK